MVHAIVLHLHRTDVRSKAGFQSAWICQTMHIMYEPVVVLLDMIFEIKSCTTNITIKEDLVNFTR